MQNNSKTQMNVNNMSNDDSGFMDISVDNSLLLTNEQERSALNELNNRFANYVEHMKQRDSNNVISKSFEEMSNIPFIQLTNLKELFKDEIKSLRDALDNQSNDATKMRIAHDKLDAENKNYENKLKEKSYIITKLTENLNKSKAENEALEMNVASLNNLKEDSSKLSNQLKECQKQLEIEVLLRTSADNACLTYKEKMEFNEAVFKKELGAILVTHKNAIKKLTSLQKNLSSSNILEQMEEARRRLKDYLSELRCSIDEDLLQRIERASSLITESLGGYSSFAKDNVKLSSNNNNLQLELEKLKASHVKLEDQLSDLESLHQEEINKLYRTISDISSSQIDDLDKNIRSLHNVSQSLTEKALLDSEITVYRKLIESEEGRTNRNCNNENDQEIKRRKINHEEHSQNSPKHLNQMNGRTILRASRSKKSCNIM